MKPTKIAKKIHTPNSTQTLMPASVPGVNRAHLALILLLCVAVYANALFMGLVWDDIPQITENPLIRSLRNIPSLFVGEVWQNVGRGHGSIYYRPFFNLSLAVDHALWGVQPFGYHLTNLLLHCFAALTLYLLVFRIAKSGVVAICSALIFAVHPVHAEAVAWISGRNEPMAAGFIFASLFFYAGFRQNNRIKDLALSLALFWCALLSKETAIVLPGLVLLYEVCFTNGTWKKRATWPAIFTAAAIPYLIVRTVVIGVTVAKINQPLFVRICTSPVLIFRYLQSLVLPVGLQLHYEIPLKTSLLDPLVILAVAVLFCILIWMLVQVRRYPVPFFGIAWIFIALLPASGLPLILQPSPIADRYLYIPSAGFALAVSWLFMRFVPQNTSAGQSPPTLGPSFWKKPAGMAGVLILLVLFILSVQRNNAWKDNKSFMLQRLADAPGYAEGYNQLGALYLDQGMLEEAEQAFKKMIELSPEADRGYSNLGLIYRKQGRLEEAEEILQKALSLKPNADGALLKYGSVLIEQGRFQEAEQVFAQCLAQAPEDPGALFGLGISIMRTAKESVERQSRNGNRSSPDAMLQKRRRLEAAEAYFKKTLTHKPGFIAALENLGTLQLDLQKYREAEETFRAYAEQAPDDARALYGRGLALVGMGNGKEGKKYFELTVRKQPKFADAYNALGFIEMGEAQFAEAGKHFEQALRLQPKNPQFARNLEAARTREKKR